MLQIVDLPEWAAVARPAWPLLVIGYWALYAPNAPAILAAWLLGICCDVLLSAPLGQHALGLVVVAIVIRRLSGIYILFPLWQAALALIPVWALYVFLMFWIDGLARHAADSTLRWMPIVSTTIAWPIFAGLLDSFRARRTRNRDRMRLP
ncbi:MAG: rod shape-determining protein MreD [Xanthomonadaceae bacterium]|nr:rod shape-determining protein MreD [Xanthomonadaceae bacterium]